MWLWRHLLQPDDQDASGADQLIMEYSIMITSKLFSKARFYATDFFKVPTRLSERSVERNEVGLLLLISSNDTCRALFDSVTLFIYLYLITVRRVLQAQLAIAS
jgi:hypothetical protein